MADRYQEVDLCKHCVEVIEKGLTEKNYSTLLAKADSMGASVDAIKTNIMSHFGRVK